MCSKVSSPWGKAKAKFLKPSVGSLSSQLEELRPMNRLWPLALVMKKIKEKSLDPCGVNHATSIR